jgi:hypothetical protein
MQRMLALSVAEYGAKGLVAIIVNEDNSFRYFQSNLNHAQTNNALAVGVHINMSDHDRKAATEARRASEAALDAHMREERGLWGSLDELVCAHRAAARHIGIAHNYVELRMLRHSWQHVLVIGNCPQDQDTQGKPVLKDKVRMRCIHRNATLMPRFHLAHR